MDVIKGPRNSEMPWMFLNSSLKSMKGGSHTSKLLIWRCTGRPPTWTLWFQSMHGAIPDSYTITASPFAIFDGGDPTTVP